MAVCSSRRRRKSLLALQLIQDRSSNLPGASEPSASAFNFNLPWNVQRILPLTITTWAQLQMERPWILSSLSMTCIQPLIQHPSYGLSGASMLMMPITKASAPMKEQCWLLQWLSQRLCATTLSDGNKNGSSHSADWYACFVDATIGRLSSYAIFNDDSKWKVPQEHKQFDCCFPIVRLSCGCIELDQCAIDAFNGNFRTSQCLGGV